MTSSNRSDLDDIHLHLKQIQHLFQSPELDPFAGQYHTRSGIEEILSELKSQSPNAQIRTTIFIPAAQLSEGLEHETLEQTCEEAIHRYCETQIHQIENETIALRRQGWVVLKMGLLLLAVCLLLSTSVNQLEILPGFVQHLLSEGFVIAGWVGLWYSVELLLFEGWLKRRDKRLYQQIQNMKLTVKADSPDLA